MAKTMAEDYWVAEWVQSHVANRVSAWWFPMCDRMRFLNNV